MCCINLSTKIVLERNVIFVSGYTKDGILRIKVYYCDAGCPHQKGSIEVNHELIQRVLPKGVTFDNLTQEKIDIMMNHINSYSLHFTYKSCISDYKLAFRLQKSHFVLQMRLFGLQLSCMTRKISCFYLTFLRCCEKVLNFYNCCAII